MNNEDLKYYVKLKQKKYRTECGQFLIEGVHLMDECLKSKYYKKNIVKVFVRNDFKDERILNRVKHLDTEYLSVKEFAKLSETENPQGIIGVVMKAENLPYSEADIICALDNINDPGNLGTIIRTCRWFGVDKILVGKDSADIYNSKVIRASQGAVFSLDIKENVNLKEELGKLENDNYEILLTDLSAKDNLSGLRFKKEKKYAVVFGNEANGISKELLEVQTYRKIKIDSFTEFESLNVASSAAVIMWEMRKR